VGSREGRRGLEFFSFVGGSSKSAVEILGNNLSIFVLFSTIAISQACCIDLRWGSASVESDRNVKIGVETRSSSYLDVDDVDDKDKTETTDRRCCCLALVVAVAPYIDASLVALDAADARAVRGGTLEIMALLLRVFNWKSKESRRQRRRRLFFLLCEF